MKVNNDSLLGPGAVGLVIVSCSGGLEFTDDKTKNVIGQTAEGTQFLARLEPAANISFVYEQYLLTNPGDMQIWNVVMSESPSAVVYNNRLHCFHQGGSISGAQTVSGNVFDGTWNTWAGDTQVPNVVMSLSPVVYDSSIYCFHQPGSNNGQLWYDVFNGSSWAGNVQVSDVVMSSSPGAVVRVYCFHQGGGSNNGKLWLYIFDGDSWYADTLLGGIRSSESPSEAMLAGQMYCLHQGPSDNGMLW